MPLVTVAIPVHNGASFLDSAIKSVKAQHRPDIELLILDDGSSDNSQNVIDAVSKGINLRVISHEAPRGLVESRNRLIAESAGDYIAWLDQDDVMAPHRLNLQLSFLTKNPEFVACGSWSVFFSHDEKTGTNKIQKMQGFPTAHEEIRSRLPFQNCLDCSSVTMRRVVGTESPLFDSNFGNALDYDMWNRLIELGKICNIPKYLCGWRLHPNQHSSGSGGEEMKKRVYEISVNKLSTSLKLSLDSETTQLLRFIHEPISAKSKLESQSVMRFLDSLIVLNNQSRFFQIESWRREIGYQKLRFVATRYHDQVAFAKGSGLRIADLSPDLLLPALRYFGFWAQKTSTAICERRYAQAMINLHS